MLWKTSDPHKSKDSRAGIHSDVYHTDTNGNRDQKHRTDFKVDNDMRRPMAYDIIPPNKEIKGSSTYNGKEPKK